MCKFCNKNIVIIPDEGPQLEFGLKNGKFGDVIKLSINPYRNELHVNVDEFRHPALVDHDCFLMNMGMKPELPKLRYASWKIKYCPFCGREL